MTPDEERELRDLRQEVTMLRGEVKDLRDFVKAMYAMLNEDGEEYDAPPDFVGGMEFGRTNT